MIPVSNGLSFTQMFPPSCWRIAFVSTLITDRSILCARTREFSPNAPFSVRRPFKRQKALSFFFSLSFTTWPPLRSRLSSRLNSFSCAATVLFSLLLSSAPFSLRFTTFTRDYTVNHKGSRLSLPSSCPHECSRLVPISCVRFPT